MIRRATEAFAAYDYATAKSEIETFFWRDLADNYLEMAKQRLYAPEHPRTPAACYTLHTALRALLKLLAPLLPYVTEAIYLRAVRRGRRAAPRSTARRWPEADPALEDARRGASRGDAWWRSPRRCGAIKASKTWAWQPRYIELQLGTPDEPLAGLLREAARRPDERHPRALDVDST